MEYKANYIGYELGNFLPPMYKGCEKAGVFFLLLQKPISNDGETFSVKLGKTRFLDGFFYTDCLKVLVYLCSNGGQFNIYNIELKKRRNGTKYFDAVDFLNQLGIAYEISDTANYRYFKSKLYESRGELILNEGESKFSVIHRRINADDYERLSIYYNCEEILISQGKDKV